MAPESIIAELGPWPLHDAAASRAAEAMALAATAPHALMQRAGLAVARLALALAPHARRIEILAGPGNNGGDGLVAALHLWRAGKAVQVTLLGDTAHLPDDAADALRQAQASGVPLQQALTLAATASTDLAIDALLGLGARRAPSGDVAQAISALSALHCPVLAVDLPSGLHPDTGMLLGEAAVHATATLSLLTLKPGLHTGHGRDLAGAVWLDRLGIAAADATAELAGPPAPPVRWHAQHKGSFGDVVVVGGAPGMQGAAWLAARAALAAGAGRVYCSLLDEQAQRFDAQWPELMARARAWAEPPGVLASRTVVCGCGGGEVVRAVLPPLLAHAGRLLIDADALNAVAADSTLQALLQARGARSLPTVLTPHPLEAARLLGTTTADVQGDRLAAAAGLAQRYGAIVVLKGSGSIVAAPGTLPSINPTGNALLATAGTGDVLAGWIGGLWSQGLTARDAARAAVWRHGRAADLAFAQGDATVLRAADLVEAMRR